METLISLLVQIISGAVGGNLAGMTKQSLGTGLNTFLGGVGGLVLGQLVSALTGTSAAKPWMWRRSAATSLAVASAAWC